MKLLPIFAFCLATIASASEAHALEQWYVRSAYDCEWPDSFEGWRYNNGPAVVAGVVGPSQWYQKRIYCPIDVGRAFDLLVQDIAFVRAYYSDREVGAIQFYFSICFESLFDGQRTCSGGYADRSENQSHERVDIYPPTTFPTTSVAYLIVEFPRKLDASELNKAFYGFAVWKK